MKNSRPYIFAKYVAAAVIVVVLVRALAVTTCSIPFSGMENTLYKGERVLVNKWSYGLRLPFTTIRTAYREAQPGDIVIFNDPRGDAPVWQRPLYASRCEAGPGDTLLLDDNLLPAGRADDPYHKHLYSYPDTLEEKMKKALSEADLAANTLSGYQDGRYMRSLSRYEHYLIKQILGKEADIRPVESDSSKYRPFIIPARGTVVKVRNWNAALLCNAIRMHEGKNAALRGDTLIVAGRPASTYKFQKDYYWMSTGNPVNPCDSRLFGLVPETHLIGRAFLIWYSDHHNRTFKKIR